MDDMLESFVKKEYECPSCGSVYDVEYDPDVVDTSFVGTGPEFCPFCGEQIESEELPEDFLDIDFTDHAQFGRGVDLVDGEEED